jgi:RNA polymerase sigma factor (TIGR02999 family)
MPTPHQLTEELSHTVASPAEQYLPVVYEELRKLAAARLLHEKPGQTLQATALVHEAWIRLSGSSGEQEHWKNKAHFFSAAAESMRRIMVDRARSKGSVRKGGEWKRVELETIDKVSEEDSDILIRLDGALAELEKEEPQCAEVIKLRFFVGMEMKEIAASWNVSERSVYRAWAFARAWIHAALGEDPNEGPNV